MEESIDSQISLCPIVPLRVLALTLLALARMFLILSLVDVISASQLWVSPDPEYRHLFAPLPWLLLLLLRMRLMGIYPLFIAPPRSYMIARARKKAAVGVMVRHLQRLDELEDSALTSFTLYYARKKRLSHIKRKAAANHKFRQRRSWHHFKNNMTPMQFHRYFRMMPNWRQLAAKGFYFIGDSAYAIKSFIIPPFNDVGTAEDNFNFYHSFFSSDCRGMCIW
jgi:hypothetical protein